MIKILEYSDKEYCLSIVKAQVKISGTKPIDSSLQESNFEKFFTDDRYVNIGYYENNELNSFLTIGFYQTIKYGNFWIIINVVNINKGNYFSFKRPEFSELFSTAFKLAESKGYYQYYYSVSKKISKIYEKQWGKYNPLNYHGVYELKDIAVVPANTIPNDELYWGLLGYETKPHDMYIKARIKKQ